MTDRRYLLGMSPKLYFGHAQTLRWCREVAALAGRHPAIIEDRAQIFVLPSFVSIPAVASIIGEVGAQDVSWAEQGAYTGEVSARQLVEVGAKYVEIGHAERRRLFGETDAVVAAKTAAALRNDLTPVLCVGEPDQGSPAAAVVFCQRQISAALGTWLQQTPKPTTRQRLIIAYEPIWAIGAAAPASPDHIMGVCGPLRDWLASEPGLSSEFDSAVIYGGSAGPGLLTQVASAVDGLFLGRFAHDPNAVISVLDEVTALDQPR